MKHLLLIVGLLLPLTAQTVENAAPPADAATQDSAKTDKKEKRWWEKRNKQLEIYYPHNAHMDVMKKRGDPCLLCHPFSKNRVTDLKQLERLNAIANEPMKAICHDCHVDNRTASDRCTLCHFDKASIWPDDHNYDYTHRHSEDARRDEGKCRTCHVDLSFCTDCHFRRNSTQRNVHQPGYRLLHGIDARVGAAECGRCHNRNYCSDCHREIP